MSQNFIPIVKPALPAITNEFMDEIKAMLESGMLSKGKYLRELESELSKVLNVKHAIATSSCTLGLLLTYSWMSNKSNKRTEVLVPSFTFMATVHPLSWVGLTPVFVDIDRETWNIDPQILEDSITENTLAMVAVHNFGNPAPINDLENIAKKHDLKLIFDSAHGIGSSYRGTQVGRFGHAEIFSLSPTKLLVGGEGGIVATNDDELAEYVTLGREYGNPGDYGSVFPGLNARMPEFNALLDSKGLLQLKKHVSKRNEIANIFNQGFESAAGIETQNISPLDESSYKDFNITVEESRFGTGRDELSLYLKSKNIDTRKYHYPPVHTHKAYEHLFETYDPKLPVTKSVSEQCISLPIWSDMDHDTAHYIVDTIIKYGQQ